MKPSESFPQSVEIELKLALLDAKPADVVKKMARLPMLAKCQPTQLQLHNVYYDTPEQHLRQQRVALRLRRVGRGADLQWLQTLKTGGNSHSALNQRGEWETPVANASLSRKCLKATPWSDMDPDGRLFKRLVPSFTTSFERTVWLVRRRDGSVVEVALDIGHIVAGDKTAPICELEFELKAGHSASLFAVAKQVARTIAVLPATQSKAERGYALAQGMLCLPLPARAPKLPPDLPVIDAAQRVLSEALAQFTGNLNVLATSDDPEVVHQARVGWRRFKSAARLFRPVLAPDAAPSWQGLHVLLTCLGELRDVDVAMTETLPPLANAYAAGNAQRTHAWAVMTDALAQDAELQRKAVRYALRGPSVGASLLAATQWLADMAALPLDADDAALQALSLRRWSRQRIKRLHRQYKVAIHAANDPESQHRVRILAKRMRYSIEAMHGLLPNKRADRWLQQATTLQSQMGAARDLGNALRLVARLGLEPGLTEFLRGVGVGRQARLKPLGPT